MIPAYDDIPPSLRALPQWVVWRNERRGDDEKPTKVPYQAKNPKRHASTRDPSTWSDLKTALDTARRHGFDGVGFVFTPDDPFVGIDFDDIIDERGRIADWARAWLERLDTYMEVSPSGRGIKVFARGSVPSAINAGGVEIYDRYRYFTVTGRRLAGAPLDVQSLDGVIDAIYAFAQQRRAQQQQLAEYERRKRYAEGALASAVERVRSAPVGTRNTTLNREAFSIAGFVASGLLDISNVARALEDAAGETGLTTREIIATLESAMRAGVRSPRDAPPSPARVSFPVLSAPSASSSSNGAVTSNANPDAWWSEGVTLAELQRATFPPLRWIVQDILPEGACLIAAKPKSKKSWLALSIAIAVSMNGRALGQLAVDPGRVLYLDLEGNRRRIQSRVRSILGSFATPWPDNLHIYTTWPRGDEGLERLEHWLLTYPDTRLIVVDLLAEIRPPRDPRANGYDYDRALLVDVNRLAERYGVGILIVHHTRKARGDDVFDEVSGTLGINGAVATLWILSRSPEGHVILSIIGRDVINDEPLALRWDHYACSFVIDGKAEEIAASIERRRVLEVLDDDSPKTPKQIAAELGKSVGSVQQLLRDLVAAGLVEKMGYGKYARIAQSGETF